MRAAVITRPGPPEVLEIRDVADPVAGPGEVLVDVVATAVNRADALQRAGKYPPPPGSSEYPGLECSGVIRALGDDVTGWAVGDEVCALLVGGGYAEQVTVPVGQLMPIPDGLSLTEAAALPEVTCTVWSLVFDRGALAPGEVLLVHGGSSGIGTTAIQLAARHGARVFTTVGSAAKAEACRALGAEITINYRDEDFVSMVHAYSDGADVILDNMGGAYLARNVDALARDGRLVVLGMQGGAKAELDLGAVMTKRATVTAAGLRARSRADKAVVVASTVAAFWPAYASGEVRPIIDSVLPLEEVVQAHRLLEASTHIGKVVLQVG